MLYYEQGPFGCLRALRAMAVKARLGPLISCFHCLGVWVSAALVLALYGLELRAVPIALAVAGFVSIAERALGGRPTGYEGVDVDE